MIRLLIADDEEDIREGMRVCVDWEGNGIELIGVAESGTQAYDAILAHSPDLVLIDIQMPGMTGLQVIDKIRNEDGLGTAFVILSGYDEFEYARKALTLKVDDYLLKPCSPEDILRAVRTSISRMEIVRSLSGDTGAEGFFAFYSEHMKKQAGRGMPRFPYPLAVERDLIKAVQVGTAQDVLRQYDAFWTRLTAHQQAPAMLIDGCFLLYVELYRLLMERGLGDGYDCRPLPEGMMDGTGEALRQFMADTLTTAHRQLGTRRETSTSVARAMHYINEHFRQELNLETVARIAHVTPSYLSSLFRQTIGESFVDYVHHVRIDQARHLLTSTALTNMEIAESIGYQSDKYFAQVFKKMTGITPSQYRQQTESS